MKLSYYPKTPDHFDKWVLTPEGGNSLGVNTGTRAMRLVQQLLRGSRLVEVDGSVLKLEVAGEKSKKLLQLSEGCITEIHCVGQWLETANVPLKRISRLIEQHKLGSGVCGCKKKSPSETLQELERLAAQFGLKMDAASKAAITARVLARIGSQ